MISDDQQDQAALAALGLLDEDERAEFERAQAADPELRALVDELREGAAALALASGPEMLPPSAELRARLLARVARETSTLAANPRSVRGSWTTWVPWTIAAAAAAISVLTSLDRDRWYSEAARARGKEMRELAAAKVSAPLMRMAIYQFEPTLAGSEQPRATVVWDAARREGELVVTQLKPPGEDHDYQLWAVEEGSKEPVSAGLVRVDPEGRATVEFKPADPGGAKVNAFALSLEPAGGSEKNQGPILLIGKP